MTFVLILFLLFRKALLLLRKKKFMESLLEKSEGELNNIEQMVHSLEFGQLQSQVVEHLKIGNDALKSLHAILDIEKIEDILEETREGVEKQRVSSSPANAKLECKLICALSLFSRKSMLCWATHLKMKTNKNC